MFDTKKAIKHSTSKQVYEYAFEKYINTIDYREDKRYNKRVCDHLGVIDTLGYNSNSGINHFSYSDEGGCIFAINTGTLWLVTVNYNEKETFVFKHNPFAEFIKEAHE